MVAREGLEFGPAFQHMQEIYTPAAKGTLYAEVCTRTLTPVIEGTAQLHPRYILHPTLEGAMLQVSLVACIGGSFLSVVARVPTRLGNVSIRSSRASQDGGVIRSTSKVSGLSTQQADTAFGRDTIPYITSNLETVCLTAALEHAISVSHFGCFGHWAHLLAAIDLVVHKNPDSHILCLSTDLALITVLLTEVLDASSLHRRFNSFFLGRVVSNGVLEVAEVRGHSVPLGLKTLKYDKPVSGIEFSLVILGSDGVILDKTPASYTSAGTTFLLAPSLDDGSELMRDRFSVLRSHSNSGHNVQLFVPEPHVLVLRSVPVPLFSNTIVIGQSAASPVEEALAHYLRTDFHTSTNYIALPDLTHCHIPPRTLVISTLEIEDSLLSNPSPEHFDAAKRKIEQASHIVWLYGM
ncbi:hypothetical protein ASPCAL05531 [Aspergillus calidoustus]|uniref:Polyketide synthase dehydratase domain-containing protein n=1 Tax=Aspergillus calidoustus TaxID=454130 RepID=A0A0U5FXV0_ASPCI|nr:hypothetical protein ASPCAL05531 [Aspergillus calidoustus]